MRLRPLRGRRRCDDIDLTLRLPSCSSDCWHCTGAESLGRANALFDAPASMTHAVLVAMVDIDRFNAINDSCGHAAGDRVLVAHSTRLRDWRTGDGVIGRGPAGGDHERCSSSIGQRGASTMSLRSRRPHMADCRHARLVPVAEAARATTLSIATVYRLVKAGEVGSQRTNGSYSRSRRRTPRLCGVVGSARQLIVHRWRFRRRPAGRARRRLPTRVDRGRRSTGGRIFDRDPPHAVHFVVRRERAAVRLHGPVPHTAIAAFAISIDRVRKPPDDRARQTRLFAHLTQRAPFGRFTAAAPPFRQRPIVLAASVDDEYFERAHPCPSPDNAA